ncbi:MAG: hypothetical protein AAF578_00245 [Pseudomonadota bacterium]
MSDIIYWWRNGRMYWIDSESLNPNIYGNEAFDNLEQLEIIRVGREISEQTARELNLWPQ